MESWLRRATLSAATILHWLRPLHRCIRHAKRSVTGGSSKRLRRGASPARGELRLPWVRHGPPRHSRRLDSVRERQAGPEGTVSAREAPAGEEYITRAP